MKSFKVGDLIRIKNYDTKKGWRVWRVIGVFLGGLGQEGTYHLEPLDLDEFKEIQVPCLMLEQAQRAALAEARKPIETCQNCNQLGVQLDLIRDEMRRIEARILESEFSEDPRLSNILEYCRRSQRDIPTFYSVIGERDRLEAENLKLRITVEDQSAAIEAMNKESEDRNQKWAEKSIYASQLEQQIANIKSQATTQRAAVEKVRNELESCRLVVQNEINVREMLGKPTQVWPDLLTGCVSGGGIESALATINAALTTNEPPQIPI